MFFEFYVFGERVIGWVWGGGGTKHFTSFEGGILNIFRRFGGWGAKFYGKILEYPPTCYHVIT
jgi:hypothetical protein